MVRMISVKAHALPSFISVIDVATSELIKLPVQVVEDVPMLCGKWSVECLDVGGVTAGMWVCNISNSNMSLKWDKHKVGSPRAKA
jgi:hypothetical protein